MNCPKCGFAQEERLDCKKCGIVFSKYMALYPSSKTTPVDDADAAPQTGASENISSEFAELQHSIRDLQRRFAEVEFERAERHRLKEEIRGLEQKLQQNESAVWTRFSDFEKQFVQFHETHSAARGELAADLQLKVVEQVEPLLGRIEQIEAKLDAVLNEQSPNPDPRIIEALRNFEQRLVELESGLASRNEEPKASVEPVTKELTELRGALQNVTLRYSEIGELKKNHLVLLNRVETLQYELEGAKAAASKPASEKARETELEVQALRAEVRQILKSVEALGETQETAEKISSIRSDIERSCGQIVELAADVAALKTHTSDIEEQIQLLHEQLENILENGQGPDPLPEPPRIPVEQDVHEIRESLCEIRTFMHSLSKKL